MEDIVADLILELNKFKNDFSVIQGKYKEVVKEN